ncbi:MAG: HDOD domain-containing protein, partial [Gammaproteobacteria bacterium]
MKTTVLKNLDLIARLERCIDLPTPPGVAEQIIGLSADSSSNISVLAEVVSLDPALTVKVLRMANSPMYSRAVSVDSLEQAVMMFGWNGTLNLALSFSLVSKIDSSKSKGLDYNFFWKRSVSAAVAAKHLGKVVGIDSRKEDLFLPGLLQDIGMLALDKAVPDIYLDINTDQHQHKIVQQIEKDIVGADHASVGAWLLEKWNLPERIINLVAISHNEERYENVGNATPAENCIEVSNVIADCICSDECKKDFHYAASVCEKILGMNKDAFLFNLEGISQEITETAAIFELDVGDPSLLNCIAEQAKELLLLRSMETLRTAEELHNEAENLEIKAKKL